ncbi:MAG: phosphoribosyl-ATP diphosphatase [Micavibrio sp.]|nr:phosphoribosyl-ATP diphosphatase [Micavibrio sp.]|tara:strand:- start:1157 stop:1516 length:360 start_codon:yes stop_codon:yes gene_type:complete
MNQDDIITLLYETLQERKNADPKKSYVAGLYKRGTKQIAKKMGEEAVELVIDAMRLDAQPDKKKRRESFTEEAADLMFHLLVLLAHHDVPPEDVFDVLRQRLGVGGLVEKASRSQENPE